MFKLKKKNKLVRHCKIPTVGANVANSVTDGWMDRQTDGKIMLLSHTLTTRGSHIGGLVKFHPVV